MGVSDIPVLRTLSVCTRESKKDARTELLWNIGFAFVPVFIVIMIVIFTRNLSDIFPQIFSVIGRGELMVYAASVCGFTLYALRHGIKGPLPDAIKDRATPLGTLTSVTGICMVFALTAYLVRRMGDLHHIDVNEGLLNTCSIIALIVSIAISYVVLSLKFSLNSGAATASHEQTEDFQALWESRDA